MASDTSTTTPATALAPGFRFHPTDEELIRYYLKRKVCGNSFRFDAVSEIDIYKLEPWDLPGKSRLKSRDLEWYFFSALDKKYGNGCRMNRSTGKGYWKATGKDREIKHDSRNVGMKKTLVFHKGRAPVGNRTDWVMHEYRLVDEELEKAGVALDAYVLCRVFHKSGLGPPSGDRYAPFIEDEWDDDWSVLVPGAEAADGVVAGDDAGFEGSDLGQDTQSNKAPFRQSEQSRDSHNAPFVCKIEKEEDSPLPSMGDPEPFQIIQNKRLRHNNLDLNHSNASENSTTTQDLCLSITTATSTTTAAAAVAPQSPPTPPTFSSTLFEFPLLESIEPKESPPVPMQRFDAVTLGISVPSGILEFINNLEKEIHNISRERETLKIKVMSAQAMINILQSRIEFLSKENEDLKRITPYA